jgi:tol-pal system protein YbgF
MKRYIGFLVLFFLLAVAPSSQAGVKEELVRLQSDVLALQNQIRMMEQSFNEQTQGLKSLVVQLNDQVAKSFLIIQKLSAELDARSSGEKTGTDAMLDEIRTISRKMDDNATRISALAQQIADMKVQSSPITPRIYQNLGSNPEALAMSADAIFHQAYNDLIQGNFDLAIEGFRAFLKNFPSSEKADDAQYNIGEAHYSARNYPEAIAAFTAVINTYPSGDKIASAYFKRAKAELLIGEKENAISDFKTVVQKYASAAEAGLATAELTQLGVDLSKPARPSQPRRKPPV